MFKKPFPQVAALSLLAVSATALAHHGWSEYDTNKPLTLKGEITESGYEHPHAYVKLKTLEKTWIGVLAPPSRMSTRGLPREELKTGAEATLYGYPNRAKPEEMRAERITIGDKTVELRR